MMYNHDIIKCGGRTIRAKFFPILMILVVLCVPAFGQTTAKNWTAKGLALSAQGEYDDAIKAYDEAIRLDPNLVETWSNKGVALAILGKYDEAIQALDEAIRLNPNYAAAWNNKGPVLEALGRTTEAKATFAKARELGLTG